MSWVRDDGEQKSVLLSISLRTREGEAAISRKVPRILFDRPNPLDRLIALVERSWRTLSHSTREIRSRRIKRIKAGQFEVELETGTPIELRERLISAEVARIESETELRYAAVEKTRSETRLNNAHAEKLEFDSRVAKALERLNDARLKLTESGISVIHIERSDASRDEV